MSLTLWQPKSSSDRPLPRTWVRSLLQKLTARYGTLFADRYGSVPTDVLEAEWAAELGGFTAEELQRGMAGLRACKLPPTLPEFMALCRPPIDAHAAFVEALQNGRAREFGDAPAYSHPAVYWAAVEIGTHDMRVSSYPQIRGRWERALAAQLSAGHWRPVPEPLLALPNSSRTPCPPHLRARIDKAVAEITARFTTMPATVGTKDAQ